MSNNSRGSNLFKGRSQLFLNLNKSKSRTLELIIFHYISQNCSEMTELECHIERIEPLKTNVLECFKKLNSGNLTLLDIFCISSLNRTFNILCGFIDLMKADNFLCAAPLTRMQIDSLLRLYAIKLIKNQNEFIEKVMEGERIDKFKSNDNKLLTDSYLVSEISKLKVFEWVERIYKAGNSYIHLTDKHIFSAMKTTDQKNTVVFSLGQFFVPEKEKIGAIVHMENITMGIILLVNSLENTVC